MAQTAFKTAPPDVALHTLDDEAQDLDHDRHSGKMYATAYDVRDMNVLGIEPIYRRRFKFIAMIGFSSTVVLAWQNVLITFIFVLYNGGTGGLFWTFIFTIFTMAFVYLTLAELASCYPTAGGQYQWVAECAPPSTRRLLSYCTGWLCSLAWATWLSSAGVFTGNMIKQCILLYHPNSTSIASQWFPTIVAVALLILGGLFNTYFTRTLPGFETIMLVMSIGSWIGILTTLWVTSPIGNPSEVLFTFSNGGHWSSPAVATLIGVITPWSSLMGYDSSVHMTENTRDASKIIPWSLMAAFGINATLSFVMAITLIFCVGDITQVLSDPNIPPFMMIMMNSTGSKAATILMTTPIVLGLMAALLSEVATSSRQLWSFARDGGMPFSKYLEPVHDGEAPRNAIWAVIGFACAIACVNFGPVTGFNAIVSIITVSLAFSYTITIFCVLLRRARGPPLPRERFTLGAFGPYINVAALAGVAPVTVITIFPADAHTTPALMNWAIVVFGAMVIFAAVYYVLVGRRRFSPVSRKQID